MRSVAEQGGAKFVHPPAQVLGREFMALRGNKKRCLMLLERPVSGVPLEWAEFRRRVRRIAPKLDKDRAATRPIPEHDRADAILRIWTPAGRLSRKLLR